MQASPSGSSPDPTAGYHINLANVLKQAWQAPAAGRAVILQVCLLVIMVVVLFTLLQGSLAQEGGDAPRPLSEQFALDLLVTVITAPLICAAMLMGIYQSIGRAPKLADLLDVFSKFAQLALTALLIAIVVQMGLLLFILPGLYLAIATGFAMPLLVEKDLSPIDAIRQSVLVVNRHWLAFIKLYLLFILLFALSMFTFGIALIWVLPWYFNVKGILYRDLFGVTGQLQSESDSRAANKPQEAGNSKDDEDNFYA